MSVLKNEEKNIREILLHQLRAYWTEVNEHVIDEALPETFQTIAKGFWGLPNPRYFNGSDVQFSPYISVHWMIFLYRLSHVLFIRNKSTPIEADQVYYLNKIMHGNDWFYAIELPVHFLCEHPLGSILGRAKYGDYLFVYQGTTVGGNWSSGTLYYTTIGDNVTLYANSTVLGKSIIGNNVLISSGTYLINETIPDNCIVFGRSPEIIVKAKTEEEIKQYTQHIWGWK